MTTTGRGHPLQAPTQRSSGAAWSEDTCPRHLGSERTWNGDGASSLSTYTTSTQCKPPVGTHNKDHSEKGLFSQGLAFFGLLDFGHVWRGARNLTRVRETKNAQWNNPKTQDIVRQEPAGQPLRESNREQEGRRTFFPPGRDVGTDGCPRPGRHAAVAPRGQQKLESCQVGCTSGRRCN